MSINFVLPPQGGLGFELVLGSVQEGSSVPLRGEVAKRFCLLIVDSPSYSRAHI